MNLKSQRIAVYARYSTDRQSAASLDDQLRVCREYVERAGGEVANELVFVDAGLSGASTARPGLQAMLEAARAGLVDVVVTEDLSRLGRHLGHNDRMLRDLNSWGARLLAVQDGFDTGAPKARLLGAIKSAMAEDYLDELKARTKRGLDGRFDLGLNTGGRAYGYRSEPVPEGNGSARWVVHEPDAAIVRRIFSEWIAGHALRAIAERLNADGIPSPRGGAWQHVTVRALLGNELYTGLVTFNKRQWHRDETTGKRRNVKRPPSEWRRAQRPGLRIVDQPTWDAAQERRALTALQYKANVRHRREYALSGLLYCTKCSSPLIIGGKARYVCGSAKRGTGCKNTASLREDRVRATVLRELRDLICTPERLEKLRTDYAAGVGSRDREMREELRQRRASLTTLESRLSALLDLVLDGDHTPATRAKRLELEDHAELQRAAIARLEAALQTVPALPSPERIQEFLEALPEVATNTPERARLLVGRLVGGRIDVEPPTERDEAFWLTFNLDATGLMKTAHSPVGLWAGGGCGGRI